MLISHIQFTILSLVLYLSIEVGVLADGTSSEPVHPTRSFPGHTATCGLTNPDQKDTRTWAPWAAVVFLRIPTANTPSAPRYYTTGVLIGPSTVLTAATGTYGAVPRGTNATYYKLPSAKSFLVGVGLPSTKINSADNYTQFSQVNYVLPYYSMDSKSGTSSHFLLFHLKTILNTGTRYVREICLHRKEDVEEENKANAISVLSGYSKGITYSSAPKLSISLVEIENSTLCQKAYRFHFREPPSHVSCARLTFPHYETPSVDQRALITNEGTCSYFYGGHIVSAYESGPRRRHFLTALLISKPFYTNDCWEMKRAYFANIVVPEYNQWLNDNYVCSPTKFACRNSTCIPLYQVCNGVADCPSGEDEDRIFCNASTECSTIQDISDKEQLQKLYTCGLHGQCLPSNKICDGTNDCDDESDENPERCSLYPIIESTFVTCNPLIPPTGTTFTCADPSGRQLKDCSGNHPVGSKVTATCINNFRPRYAQEQMVSICDQTGNWTSESLFDCVPDCGQFSKDGDRFMWSSNSVAAVGTDLNIKYVCGGTYLEKRFLITTATCAKKAAQHQPFNSFFLLNHTNVAAGETFEAGDKFWLTVDSTHDIRLADESSLGITLVKAAVTFANLPWLEADRRNVNESWLNVAKACYLPAAKLDPVSIGDVGKVPIYIDNQRGRVTIKNMTVVVCPETVNRFDATNKLYFCIDGSLERSEKLKDGHGFFMDTQPNAPHSRYSLRGMVLGRVSSGSSSSFDQQSESTSPAKGPYLVLSLEPYLDRIIDYFEVNLNDY